MTQSGHGPRQSRVTGTMERQPSLRLDIRGLDHLGPLLGFVSDEFAEIGGRAHKYCAAQVGEPRLEFGIGKARVDFLVEPIDDFSLSTWGRKCDASPGGLVRFTLPPCFRRRHR